MTMPDRIKVWRYASTSKPSAPPLRLARGAWDDRAYDAEYLRADLPPPLPAALAVPEVAAMWHALLVWDQAHRTGRNEPLQVAFETGQSALDAIRAADPVTKPS